MKGEFKIDMQVDEQTLLEALLNYRYQIFSPTPHILEQRGNNNGVWRRGEIYLTPELIDDLIEALKQAREYLK